MNESRGAAMRRSIRRACQPEAGVPEFRNNSLDLLRLVAATQVVVFHTLEYMNPGLAASAWLMPLSLLPGVPIFFLLSGFLISKSYERSDTVVQYGTNRVLRIYPALVCCVVGNIAMVASTGYFAEQGTPAAGILSLALAKTTLLQFYNPGFMRGFGDGVLNGSLWTITVELQFYLVTPLVYRTIRRVGVDFNKACLAVILVSVLCNLGLYWARPSYSETVAWKLARVSFAPWLYMFMLGVVAQRNFDFLAKYLLKVNVWLVILGYYAIASLMRSRHVTFDNSVPPYAFAFLAIATLRAAYAFQRTTRVLLRGNDISYGLYLWHMPVVNQFLYFGWTGLPATVSAVGISYVTALASWRLVEKPFLRLKRYTIRDARGAC